MKCVGVCKPFCLNLFEETAETVDWDGLEVGVATATTIWVSLVLWGWSHFLAAYLVLWGWSHKARQVSFFVGGLETSRCGK